MIAQPGSAHASGLGPVNPEAGAPVDIDGFVDGWTPTQSRQGAGLGSSQEMLQLQRSGTLSALPVPAAPSRPPPIAGLGFVQEEFKLEEMPLGLVIDWSMALPVVSSVVPDSFAARRPSLIPGLVLVAINKNGLRPGAKRTEVEARLRDERQRPLWLVFEAPDLDRFDYSGARKRARRRNMWKVKHANALESKSPSNEGLALTTQSFFEKHPERIPLSRYGDMEVHEAPHFPLPPAATPAARSMRRVMSGPEPIGIVDSLHGMELSVLRAKHNALKLPPVLRGGFASTFSGDSADNFSSRAMGTTFGYSNNDATSARRTGGLSYAGTAATLRKAMGSKSLTWLAESQPRPDEAYEHLIDEPRTCGPGISERWPLNHEEGYICRLSDLVMAWRVRDAYEVGFRGRKREKVTEMHVNCDNGAPLLVKRVARIDEVYCDMCGVDLAAPSSLQQASMVNSVQETMGPGTTSTAFAVPAEPMQTFSTVPPRAMGAFYYCRKCKKNGNRYELCAACHAVEVLQGEGKHAGHELHPHFLRCEHQSLVRRRFVNDANMGMPHIRRIFCDHCGHLAGSYDTDSEVFVCQRCPEEHGLRFELCAPCAQTLANYGWGVRRLTAARSRQGIALGT